MLSPQDWTSPNKEGLHFYAKTGVGAGYVALGSVHAKEVGEASGILRLIWIATAMLISRTWEASISGLTLNWVLAGTLSSASA